MAGASFLDISGLGNYCCTCSLCSTMSKSSTSHVGTQLRSDISKHLLPTIDLQSRSLVLGSSYQ